MTITVNGVSEPFQAGCSLSDLLTRHGAATTGTAVARNGIVVPRSHLDVTLTEAGDVVEIVTAVQGG